MLIAQPVFELMRGDGRLYRKTVSGMLLVLLIASILTSTFIIRPVKAEGIIYIRADGSVDPPDAPIHRDGDIYTLIGNITSDTDGIAVERDNIVVDGAGYTVQGTGAYESRGIGFCSIKVHGSSQGFCFSNSSKNRSASPFN